MNYKGLKIKGSCKEPIQDSQLSLEVLLNELIAEEYIQWYQYFSVYIYLTGTPIAKEIAEKFKEWADDELQDHAVKLMNRLNELGLKFDLITPTSWSQIATAHQVVARVDDPVAQLEINKGSEVFAIARYKIAIEFADSIGDHITSDLFKQILSDEEEHYSEILDFLHTLGLSDKV